MTTDRGPKRCTVRGRRRDGLRPGQGRGDDRAAASRPCSASCRPTPRSPIPSAALRAAVAGSFERITVDGQMSTNDTVLLQATGAAGRRCPPGLLDAVLLQLALEIVADGEGATRVGRIEVRGAADGRGGRAGGAGDRQLAAGQDRASTAATRTGAGSPRRPAWRWPASELAELGPGRDRGRRARRRGGARPRSRSASDRGDGAAHVYFSDLTHDYVRINSEYTT